MEVGLISKILSRNASNTTAKSTKASFKPARRLRKITISKPYQQKLEINAYSPSNYFKDRINDVFKEMRSIYGNIPLWVNYSMFPSAVSWNLGSVQATHSLLVYGEKQFAKEFLSRLNEIIRNDELSVANGISILNQNGSTNIQSLSNVDSDKSPLPNALLKTANNTSSRSSLLGASSLIAGLAGIVLALSFFSNRRSSNSKQRVSRQAALKAAISSVSELMSEPPILENEEFTGQCWRFKLSNYLVTVDGKGMVTEVRRVGENG
ncbi:MAG: hypothetical protein QXU46_02155 [Candidatus Bathyarchaeia archaeon]